LAVSAGTANDSGKRLVVIGLLDILQSQRLASSFQSTVLSGHLAPHSANMLKNRGLAFHASFQAESTGVRSGFVHTDDLADWP
jgi:hypothetical protein